MPNDRKFIGFDAYKKAMDCLKPGDVAIFATPPAFRWVHFNYAIEKGLNVFMEKPVTVDGPTSRKMFALAEEADKKNLKVGVGLMCRHCEARKELFDRIQDGEIGQITMLRAYRMHPPVGSAFTKPKPADQNELMWQIKNFHSFLWASGGCYSDFYIHNIDECCWMKNAWPVKAQALGGRHYRGDNIDQNFDNYAVEYTFDDGAKLWFDGRTMAGCQQEFASYAHGTKGSAHISGPRAMPRRSARSTAIRTLPAAAATSPGPTPSRSPARTSWNGSTCSTPSAKTSRTTKCVRGTQASLVTSMGRMAAPHRPRSDLRRDSELGARVCPGRRSTGARRPGADPGQRRRQVSGSAAGHHRPIASLPKPHPRGSGTLQRSTEEPRELVSRAFSLRAGQSPRLRVSLRPIARCRAARPRPGRWRCRSCSPRCRPAGPAARAWTSPSRWPWPRPLGGPPSVALTARARCSRFIRRSLPPMKVTARFDQRHDQAEHEHQRHLA